jgi:hypothetical protein
MLDYNIFFEPCPVLAGPNRVLMYSFQTGYDRFFAVFFGSGPRFLCSEAF